MNIKDDDQKEKYRKWIDSELENFNPELKYGTLTVYIKCGHPESRTNELETFALFFEILEVARLENRNLIVIVSGMETNEKTYIFAPLDVAIYDNNNTEKVHTVNGIIMILNDLLSGAKPPKPKMSLNISFKSSNVSAQKKKIFKTKPIMIKLG